MKNALTFFDVTNITIGSIVGADIYIASAITAGMIGPFALVVWVIAGALAIVLALVLAYCSSYVPKVGGPFAYVSEAFNDFWGFLTGWCLWIAELIALPVFAIAFVNYLGYFVHLNTAEKVLIKGGFLLTMTLLNIVGVKAAGTINDVLTILKLAPLLLLMFSGFAYLALNPDTLKANYVPFTPLGIGQIQTAVVLIFWAYDGFELSTIPASEVKDPGRTIPRAIVAGIISVTLFYLATNFVVYGTVNWKDLGTSSTPLVLAGTAILGTAGAVIMSLGALISVSGSDESDMLASARLSYAMSVDGLFPKSFSSIHPKFGTPYIALAVQGLAAFVLSIYSGIANLISFSVFNLGFAFLMCCLSLIVLRRTRGKPSFAQIAISWLGVAICIYLLYSTSTGDKIAGAGLILAGILLYMFFSPKVDIHTLKSSLLSVDTALARSLEIENRFLGSFFRLLRRWLKGLR